MGEEGWCRTGKGCMGVHEYLFECSLTFMGVTGGLDWTSLASRKARLDTDAGGLAILLGVARPDIDGDRLQIPPIQTCRHCIGCTWQSGRSGGAVGTTDLRQAPHFGLDYAILVWDASPAAFVQQKSSYSVLVPIFPRVVWRVGI